MPGRHHVSVAVERRGSLYWLDAGETCSYTAHLAGLDLLATRAIFISHCHMDHVGGLANLLWTLRKLDGRSQRSPTPLAGRVIPLYIPNLATADGVFKVLSGTEGGFATTFAIEPRRFADGVIYEADGLRVSALHNRHLGPPGDDGWQSFSFRIEADGASAVFSGDVAHVSELDPWIEGCDALLMETGHHRVEDICGHLKQGGKSFGRLVLIHHGRAVLADAQGELRKARDILGDRVLIAEDGMALDLSR
jgi:ribonuclease BN (tRNA processing enzyme)